VEIFVMDHATVEQLFRSLQLETEEQRIEMRFERLITIDGGLPMRVITTETTCQTAPTERREVA
jgi:hypothetical protein